MRILVLSLIALSTIYCSPEHRSGNLSTASDLADKPDGDGMPFSELVEKVFQPTGCFDCHNTAKRSFKNYETVLKIVTPGNAQTSKLYLRSSTDMPPIEEGYMPLTDDQLQIVRDWIDQGANP